MREEGVRNSAPTRRYELPFSELFETILLFQQGTLEVQNSALAAHTTYFIGIVSFALHISEYPFAA
jgi:hypothetical protein